MQVAKHTFKVVQKLTFTSHLLSILSLYKILAMEFWPVTLKSLSLFAAEADEPHQTKQE